MKSLSPLLILFLALLFSSCGSFNCIEGNGSLVTVEIGLDIIKEIKNNTSVDIELRYGQDQKVEVTGHRNLIDMIERDVTSDRWIIGFTDNVCTEDLSIRITLPEIEAIEVDGSGDVVASTPFQTDNFDLVIDGSGGVSIDISAEEISVEVDGSGNVTLNGYADELNVNIDGSGDLAAFDLKSKEAYINSHGSGNVELTVDEELDVSIKGSGNVTYKGDPRKMEFNQKGSGKITKK